MFLRTLLTASFLGLLSIACTGGAAVADGVTLVIEEPPTSLDPRIGTDATSERLFELIFSFLVRKDETANIVPDLAESWETPDPLTYVFHLREGVRFHDGRRLTANDVVYTFRTIMDGSVRTIKGATALRLVESLTAVDERTVRIRLAEPFSPFLWNLIGLGIVPAGSGEDLSETPIGSGPFRFGHYIRDGEIEIRANPDYHGPRPRVETVRFKIVPEAVVRALELRKGTVDIALNVLPADTVEALRDDPKLKVMSREGTNYQYLAFNMEDPVFGDRRARQAIAHAIDREAIIRYLLRDQARLADSVIPPENWAYFDDVARYDYNPGLARTILEEAGYPDLSFTYRTSTDEASLLVASVIQEQLREVGVRMAIRSNEFATFYSDVISGNFQVYSLRWIGGNNDPDHFNLIFHSEMVPPNGANRGHYSNPQVDRWIELARREIDQQERKKHYAAVQQIVAEELPYVSLWYHNNVAVYNKRIQGLRLDPTGSYEFLNEIWVEGSSDGAG